MAKQSIKVTIRTPRGGGRATGRGGRNVGKGGRRR
jgi:hypothetical protein